MQQYEKSFGKYSMEIMDDRTTAVWQYGGYRLNLKLVLYLQNQC